MEKNLDWISISSGFVWPRIANLIFSKKSDCFIKSSERIALSFIRISMFLKIDYSPIWVPPPCWYSNCWSTMYLSIALEKKMEPFDSTMFNWEFFEVKDFLDLVEEPSSFLLLFEVAFSNIILSVGSCSSLEESSWDSVIEDLKVMYSYLQSISYTVGGNAIWYCCVSWNWILKVSVMIEEKLFSMWLKSSWYSFFILLSNFDSWMANFNERILSTSSYQQTVNGFLDSLNTLKYLSMMLYTFW